MSNWSRTNQAIGLFLSIALALLFAYIWFSPWAHRVMRDGFLLGFFPMLGVAAMLICALAMTVDPLRHEVHKDVAELRLIDMVQVVALLLGIGAYFSAMTTIGFILVTPVFLFVYMMWFRVRPVRLTVILSITIPAGVYILFSLLGVRLPNGILPALF
jgi:hypothetical protein